MRPKAPDTGRDCSSPRAQLSARTAAPGSGPAAGCERKDAGRIGRMMDENKWLRFLCGSGCQVDNQELIKTAPDGLAGRMEKWIRGYTGPGQDCAWEQETRPSCAPRVEHSLLLFCDEGAGGCEFSSAGGFVGHVI